MILEVFLINYFFCVIFQRFFAIFSVSFQYFLKWVSALKFPLNAKESYANNIVLSVESIKLTPNIKAKMVKTGRRFNRAIFYLNCLRYWDYNKIKNYLNCNYIKGSVD